MELWEAYSICETGGKSLRLAMKNGQILEGAPYYFALGYPEDNYNDTVRLDGPKGSDSYMDGHSIICAHDIVKLEIIDRE